MTATPYMTDDSALHYTDALGRPRLGYRGGAGAAPVYAGFEDLFRGSEALIRERQRVYLDVIGLRAPVVDLGSGRGEMLQLLAAAGIEARGVDLDEAMVERARATGADVHHGDALDFLMKQEDASLGAIFSAQFIEHLPTALLPELLEIARSKLRPDGLFIAETVNPHSPRALKVFWLDPTHQHPLFPETMLALCTLHGLRGRRDHVPARRRRPRHGHAHVRGVRSGCGCEPEVGLRSRGGRWHHRRSRSLALGFARSRGWGRDMKGRDRSAARRRRAPWSVALVIAVAGSALVGMPTASPAATGRPVAPTVAFRRAAERTRPRALARAEWASPPPPPLWQGP